MQLSLVSTCWIAARSMRKWSPVHRLKQTVKPPRQECRNVTVTHRRPVQDENRIAGSVLERGGGRVIGHQFGGGHGRSVATVGRCAGRRLCKRTRSRARCEDNDTRTPPPGSAAKTVYDKSDKMLGYDVTYKIERSAGKIRMDHDPGSQIPLDNNGQLVLDNKI
ncbi:glycine zipper 2TM domain-containing protein [Klebsiella pneumoniae subsp. pneumoniae]|nr:glycine zipper 2TM domain-containing protein [Klebsiella pneumoniae subsp. pneumoniae]